MKLVIILSLFALTGCSSCEYQVCDGATKLPLNNALVLSYCRGNSEVFACASDKTGKFSVNSAPDIILVGKEGYAIKVLGKYSSHEIFLENMNKISQKMELRKKHSELFVNFDENPILLPTFLLNKLPKNSPYFEKWALYSQYLKSKTEEVMAENNSSGGRSN